MDGAVRSPSRLLDDRDGLPLSVLLDVPPNLGNLVWRHPREQSGGGMDRENVAPGFRHCAASGLLQGRGCATTPRPPRTRCRCFSPARKMQTAALTGRRFVSDSSGLSLAVSGWCPFKSALDRALTARRND